MHVRERLELRRRRRRRRKEVYSKHSELRGGLRAPPRGKRFMEKEDLFKANTVNTLKAKTVKVFVSTAADRPSEPNHHAPC